MPAPPTPFPGQVEQVGQMHQLEAAAQQCPKCPWDLPVPLQRLPGAGRGIATHCPGSGPCPTQHCPCSPLQISDSFSSLSSPRCRAASPRHRALSDLLLPSMLPAAQLVALLVWPHTLLPLSRVTPGKDSTRGGVGPSKAATKATCAGRGGRGTRRDPGCPGPAWGSRGSGSHRAAPCCQCSGWEWDQAAKMGTPGAAVAHR